MKIGIDISQVAYEGTGVANFVKNLVEQLVRIDKENEYIFFYSSLRKNFQFSIFNFSFGKLRTTQSHPQKNITVKQIKLPPTFLDFVWNRLHILPIEWFIGDVDIFISSDWTQPPTKAKKVTILYDLIVYKYPEETHNQTKFNIKKLLLTPDIVSVQKRRLHWVKKECDQIICISEATRRDAVEVLGIDKKRLSVVYPGI